MQCIELFRIHLIAIVKLVIGKEVLVTEVTDKVIVIEDKEDIVSPKEIMSIVPTILVNKI